MSEANFELPENWKETLPEDMRSSGVLETVKSIEGLAKMAIDGRNLANTALRIPSDEASDEDRSTFRQDLMSKMPDLMFKPKEDDADSFTQAMKALGMPDDVAGYELPDMPESIKENMDTLAANAHKAGLTKSQLKAITEGILGDYKTNAEAAAGMLETAKGELKQEWGAAYESKVNTIKHFAKQTGFSDAFVDAIANGQIDSANMKAFDTVIKGFEGEGVEIGKQPNDTSAVMPPAEAEAQINDIMGNKKHAYWNSADPAHQAAVEKIVELGRLAEAGTKQTETDKFRMALQA